MGQLLEATRRLRLKEIDSSIAYEQPRLRAELYQGGIRISGVYLLHENRDTLFLHGPIAEFQVEIEIDDGYPNVEPKVKEIGGRIPRQMDRHINDDGVCCITVWEHWLVENPNHSFDAFFDGPFYNFFLGQFWFETTGTWPFGEFPHGLIGMLTAYAETLDVPAMPKPVCNYLELLCHSEPKGHWQCPCGSGQRLRKCHHPEVTALREKVSPEMARRMLRRLLAAFPAAKQSV